MEHRSIPIWSYAFVLSFVSVLVSEYGQLGNQHPDANPNFHASLSEGLFMADDLVAMIGLGIPAAAKSNLTDFVSQPGPPGASAVGAALNAMIAGPGPNFELQPTGMVPEMFRPMTNQFVQSTTVSNNPTRTLVNGASLPSLVTLASRSARWRPQRVGDQPGSRNRRNRDGAIARFPACVDGRYQYPGRHDDPVAEPAG